MNSKNSKTSDPHRPLLNLTDKIDLKNLGGRIQGSSSSANDKVVFPSYEMLNRLKRFKMRFYTIKQFMHISSRTLMR